MILHYEDKDGNINEIDFHFRLATAQSREQYRNVSNEAGQLAKKLDKGGTALNTKLNDEREKLLKAAESGVPIEELEANVLAAETAVNEYGVEAEKLGDATFNKYLRLCAAPETRGLLTDEVLAGADLEEVRAIVATFRGKLKI